MVNSLCAALEGFASGTTEDEVGDGVLGGLHQVEASSGKVGATIKGASETGDAHGLLGRGDGSNALGSVLLPEVQEGSAG